MKEEINKFTIRVGYFEMRSKIIDIISKQEISTDIEAMKTTKLSKMTFVKQYTHQQIACYFQGHMEHLPKESVFGLQNKPQQI